MRNVSSMWAKPANLLFKSKKVPKLVPPKIDHETTIGPGLCCPIPGKLYKKETLQS
jgi:hypothetical protein